MLVIVNIPNRLLINRPNYLFEGQSDTSIKHIARQSLERELAQWVDLMPFEI